MTKKIKRIVGLLLAVCVMLSFAGCALPKDGTQKSEGQKETEPSAGKQGHTSSMTAKLLYMGQASIRITTPEGKVIYIDPYAGDGYEPAADLILVTHKHYDHNGVDKVSHRSPDCQVITWREALANRQHQRFDLDYCRVEAVEAGYNRWHDVKECVGYIVTLTDGTSVYVTGDTSKTEQMKALADQHIDYAFYCCDGVFNMDLDEAAECAKLVDAKHNIPYHVLAQDGVSFDRARAERFEAPNRLIVDEGEEIDLEPARGEKCASRKTID